MVPPTGLSNPNKHELRGGTDGIADGRIQTPKFAGFQMESSHIDKSAPEFIDFAKKRKDQKLLLFLFLCKNKTN